MTRGLVLSLLWASPAVAETAQTKWHPSYAGVCVPIAEDVDCASGSGDGPYHVTGPVYVIGPDEYGLDRDGDGVACEPKG